MDREAFTMALLAKFQKKLETVKEKAEEREGAEAVEEPVAETDEADLGMDDGKWWVLIGTWLIFQHYLEEILCHYHAWKQNISLHNLPTSLFLLI